MGECSDKERRALDLLRGALKNSQGFISAWEFNWNTDGERLHDELKTLLDIDIIVENEDRNDQAY